MGESNLKTEVLLELILSVKIDVTEQEVISHCLPVYLRKLNCFMAGIIKTIDKDQAIESILPHAFVNSVNWKSFKSYYKEIYGINKNELVEVVINDEYYYVYPLAGYGLMVLGRKQPFDHYFKHELKAIINHLNRSLISSVEEEKRKQTEKTLINERKLLRTIIDNIPINIYTKDKHFYKTLANLTEIKHLGFTTEDQVLGKDDYAIYPEEFAQRAFQEDLEVIEKGLPVLNELRKIDSDHWALISKIPLKDSDGNIDGLVGISVDITERKKLLEQLGLLQNLIDNSSDAVLVTHEDGRLIYVNQVSAKLFGIQPADAMQFNIFDLDSNFDSPKKWDAHLEALKKSEFLILEKAYTNINSGKITHVEDTAKYINLSGTGYVIISSRDISRRKLAETTIAQQIEMQRLLIKISSTYINIDLEKEKATIQQSLHELGNFVGADRAYIFDYDFKNNTTSNTYEWCAEGITPEIENLQNVPIDYFPQWVESHRRGEAFDVPDVSALKDDGEGGLKNLLEAQGIKSLIAFPMMTLQNELIGFVGFDAVRNNHTYSDKEKTLLFIFAQMLVNIRERKRKETLLKHQEEKYRNIATNMNLGLLEVDLNDRIEFANQSFLNLSGYTFDEIKGKKAGDLFVSEASRAIINNKNEMRTKGIADSYEILVRTKKRETRWWLISGAPNYNDQGEITGSLGVHLDITDQKRMAEKLETALKVSQAASLAKETFLANMSHEIRTPLNGIIGMIREISKEKLSPAVEKNLIRAQKASDHLLSIINNILDLSKIEAGELTLEAFHFDLKELLQDVKHILENQALKNDNKLEVIVDGPVAAAHIGDETRIRQILINLTGNALKFTEHGKVVIRCRADAPVKGKQRLVISVIDNGVGMEQEFVKKVFSKFQQEDISNTRKYGGTGLGLVITKQLVELMQGGIGIKSEKGKGTEITLDLILAIGNASEIVTNKSGALHNLLHEKSILLVEDNELNRLVLTNTLRPYKLKITEAENGLEAVELVKRQDFDLIFMDLQMPLMDGLEATRIIREVLKNTTPIVALTANAFRTEIEKCQAVGMNEYIIKPFEEKDLFAVISNLLKIDPVADNGTTVSEKNDPKPGAKSALYDLEGIKMLSMDNDDFVLKMIRLFTETTPNTIREIDLGIETGDLALIKRSIHRIKPSVHHLGALDIYNSICEIEEEAQKGELNSQLIKKVTDLSLDLAALVIAIRENELPD